MRGSLQPYGGGWEDPADDDLIRKDARIEKQAGRRVGSVGSVGSDAVASPRSFLGESTWRAANPANGHPWRGHW